MPISPRKLLFAAALATTTLGTAAANPAGTPLRNVAQRPATGNIGQRGQPDRAAVLVAAATPIAAPVRAAHGFLLRALLRPRAAITVDPAMQPLRNSEQRPACSNLISKRAAGDGDC